MPPKKRPTAVARGKQPAKPRRSKLAQEHEITAEDEAEIKAAWSMFALQDIENYEGEKEGVIRTDDVRRAMKAQGIPPSNAAELREFIEILDSESDGYVTYSNFVAVCALKINARSNDDDSKAEEVADAFKLFTRGTDGPITILHLRRVAKELKEEVSDEMLRNMILEANGGAGVNRGVGMDDFQGVMTRAGIFS